MKIIYLLLLFGFISSKTPEKVTDIWYNFEYSLQTDLKFGWDEYDFRLPTNYKGHMDVEVKIPQGDKNTFSFRVFEYTTFPKDSEIINYEGGKEYDRYTPSAQYEEGDYVVYSYQFYSSETTNYFAIHVFTTNYGFSYLVFRVSSDRYRYSYIKDLDFNTDYNVATTKFDYQLIPYQYQIFIRISVFEDDKMEIQLTTHKAYDKKTAFQVDVCEYSKKPLEDQVYYPDKAQGCKPPLENISDDDNKYYYPFTTDKGINYLTIRIINNLSDLNYLFIYIYSEKGLAAGIIAAIVIGVVIVVGGIGYFIGRKLGCCNK